MLSFWKITKTLGCDQRRAWSSSPLLSYWTPSELVQSLHWSCSAEKTTMRFDIHFYSDMFEQRCLCANCYLCTRIAVKNENDILILTIYSFFKIYYCKVLKSFFVFHNVENAKNRNSSASSRQFLLRQVNAQLGSNKEVNVIACCFLKVLPLH